MKARGRRRKARGTALLATPENAGALTADALAAAEVEFKAACSAAIAEFFANPDFVEALWALGEATAAAEARCGAKGGDSARRGASGGFVRLFVKRLIAAALDRGARQRELAACLLSALRGEGVSPLELEEGFALLLDALEDLSLDVPDAPELLAFFLARATLDDAVTRGFVDECACACGATAGGAAAAAARALLCAPGGAARIRGAWGGKDGSSVEAAKAQMDALLGEYVSSLDMSEAERRLRVLEMPFFHHELVKRALEKAITYAEKRPPLVALLSALSASGVVSASQMAVGFERTVERLPDLRLDVPDAREGLALLAAELRSARLLPARLSAWALLQQRKTGSGSLRLGSESCLAAMSGGGSSPVGDDAAPEIDALDDLDVPAGGWHDGMARVRPVWSGLRAPRLARTDSGRSRASSSSSGLSPKTLKAHFPSSPNLTALDTTELIKPECRARSHHHFEDDYDLGAFLGSGGFAAVYHCTHRRTGTQRAVKIIRVSASDDAEDNEMTFDEVMNELALLARLDHPNVVKVHQYFFDSSTRLYHVVMDLLEGPELMEALASIGSYNEGAVRTLMRRLFEAVAHLHSHGVCHRDLKLENLMLRRKGDLDSLTLFDFGLGKAMHARAREREQCGTAWYSAPELLLGVGYSTKVDSWACGVTMWALLTGSWPFGDSEEDEDAVADEVIEGLDFNEAFARPQWRHISVEARDLLRGLLSSSVRARLSPVEALEHAWFLGTGGEDGDSRGAHLAARLSETHSRLEALSRARRQAMPSRVFAAGERIAIAGRRYNECLLVREGEATIVDADGRAIGALGIGALIGEVCATPRDGALAQHTVVAATPLVAAVIAGEAMQLAAARDYRRAPDFRAALEARRKALRSAAKRQ